MEKSPAFKRKSNKICSVPQCSNYAGKGVSLHTFPADKSLQKKWQILFKIGKKLPKTAVACNEHFDESCFLSRKGKGGRNIKRLKPESLPSLKLPTRPTAKIIFSPSKEKYVLRQERAVRRRLFRESSVKLQGDSQHSDNSSSTLMEVSNEVEAAQVPSIIELKAAEILMSIHHSALSRTDNTLNEATLVDETVEPTFLSTSDEEDIADMSVVDNIFNKSLESADITLKAVEPQTEDKVIQTEDYYHFLDLIKTNDILNAWTGINSFKLLDVIVSLTEMIRKKYGCQTNFKLDMVERIVMVMIKIKTCNTNTCIASLFSVTPTTFTNYFFPTIDVLYLVMKQFVTFPSRDSINNNMPQCFIGFLKTRIVLDCTETPLEKVSCLPCRIRTYSHYKGTHTIKFMVGCSPDGLITYVSKVHGGRASDKHIFNSSDLIKLMDKSDAVMVDKGFNIDKECFSKGIIVFKPPFLRNKKQFSPAEGTFNTEIARARVHVERIMQRIKIYNIFSQTISWTILSHIDKILTIVCGFVNLSRPIIGPKGF